MPIDKVQVLYQPGKKKKKIVLMEFDLIDFSSFAQLEDFVYQDLVAINGMSKYKYAKCIIIFVNSFGYDVFERKCRDAEVTKS